MKRHLPPDRNSVFINCPFDKEYRNLFNALVFTVQSCGFTPRCALEDKGTDEVRIQKIIEIMRGCLLGIHDLSRTESNASGLPRFNMPLELGLFMGAKYFGDKHQALKRYLVIDKRDFAIKEYLSDISGQDIESHDNTDLGIISVTRGWLSHRTSRKMAHGSFIFEQYQAFQKDLPDLCKEMKWTVDELGFNEFTGLVRDWLNYN